MPKINAEEMLTTCLCFVGMTVGAGLSFKKYRKCTDPKACKKTWLPASIVLLVVGLLCLSLTIYAVRSGMRGNM